MSAPWTLREADQPAVCDEEYGALVFLSRNTMDDLLVIAGDERFGECTGGDLAEQIGRELQAACDAGDLVGRFQVVAVGNPALTALATVPRGWGMEPAFNARTRRILALAGHLSDPSPDSEVVATVADAEREAAADLAAIKGHTIRLPYVKGYVGETDQQEEMTAEDGFLVIVDDGELSGIRWTSNEDFDPIWDVTPAPGETRLDGMRSLWGFGRSYRVRTQEEPSPAPVTTTGTLQGEIDALGHALDAGEADSEFLWDLHRRLKVVAGSPAAIPFSVVETLGWMIENAVDASSERLPGLFANTPEQAQTELREVIAVRDWFIGLPTASQEESDRMDTFQSQIDGARLEDSLEKEILEWTPPPGNFAVVVGRRGSALGDRQPERFHTYEEAEAFADTKRVRGSTWAYVDELAE